MISNGIIEAVQPNIEFTISTDLVEVHFSETRVGGLIGGKAGISVVHMGRGRAGLRPLLDAAEQSDCNLNQILPTHMGRCGPLFAEGVHYISLGGNIDLTADAPEVAAVSGGAARLVTQALEAGADISHITISSDGYGSQPVFNKKLECVGITYTRCSIIHDEVVRMVHSEGIPIEMALSTITRNPASRLGLVGKKGVITVGADADLVVWDDEMRISSVYAKSKLAMKDGRPLIKGLFE